MTKPIYLVVTPFFPSPSRWQGAYVLDQVKAIERTEKYRVIVFKPCGLFQHSQSYIYAGVEVNHIPSLFMPSYLFNGFGGELNGRNLIKELRKKRIPLEDIAVIHVHTAAFAGYATALKRVNGRIKSVMQYHDPDPYQIRLGKLARWKPNTLYRARKLMGQFEYIDLHLCISKKVEYNLTHFPHPHPEECYDSYKQALAVCRKVSFTKKLNTYVLYNGVDTSQFHRIPNQKDTSIFKIGCIGNFIDWKNQITLIKAIHYLVQLGKADGIKVSFVGSGATQKECEEYINKHQLADYFVFEKEVHHSELPRYYNTLDLFVLPSFFEGFGCVFTEAAACGVPFMGCVNQGYSEYIPEEERDKWLIKPGDYTRLTGIIEAYMKSRYRQKLCKEIAIDSLMTNYINYLLKIS